MNKKTLRCRAALLAACILMCALFGSAAADRSLSDIIDLTDYPSSISPGMLCDTAFSRGNDCYEKGKYEEARGYYVFALQKIEKSRTYHAGDVCNNLVLTLLQLEKNVTAYELCRYMLEENLAPSVRERFGYMLNLLVCAHANGIPAARELSDALDEGWFSFDELLERADSEPRLYRRLLNAMIFNVLYIDLEGDAWDGASSLYYLPDGHFSGVTNMDLMEKLAEAALGGLGERGSAEEPEAREYLEYVRSMLVKANDWNIQTWGAADEDITELIRYAEAKLDRLP